MFDSLAQTGHVCCTVTGYLGEAKGILCMGMCVLSLQKPIFTVCVMWEWYVVVD